MRIASHATETDLIYLVLFWNNLLILLTVISDKLTKILQTIISYKICFIVYAKGRPISDT